jgi:hypothetical protein
MDCILHTLNISYNKYMPKQNYSSKAVNFTGKIKWRISSAAVEYNQLLFN